MLVINYYIDPRGCLTIFNGNTVIDQIYGFDGSFEISEKALSDYVCSSVMNNRKLIERYGKVYLFFWMIDFRIRSIRYILEEQKQAKGSISNEL